MEIRALIQYELGHIGTLRMDCSKQRSIPVIVRDFQEILVVLEQQLDDGQGSMETGLQQSRGTIKIFASRFRHLVVRRPCTRPSFQICQRLRRRHFESNYGPFRCFRPIQQ